MYHDISISILFLIPQITKNHSFYLKLRFRRIRLLIKTPALQDAGLDT